MKAKKSKLWLLLLLPIAVHMLLSLLYVYFPEGKSVTTGNVHIYFICFSMAAYIYLLIVGFTIKVKNTAGTVCKWFGITVVVAVISALHYFAYAIRWLDKNWEYAGKVLTNPISIMLWVAKIEILAAVVIIPIGFGVLKLIQLLVQKIKAKNIPAKNVVAVVSSAVVLTVAAVVGGNAIYKNFFYYKLIDFDTHPWYSRFQMRYGSDYQEGDEYIDVCKTDKQTLWEKTFIKEELTEFNEANPDSRVEKPMEAVKITQQFAISLELDCCEYEQPFLLEHNEEYGTWVVIGDLWQRTWYKELYYKYIGSIGSLFGGELCVVIDDETGNILYMNHTQ